MRNPFGSKGISTNAGHRFAYLREWVYGGIDGAVTTFAVVAGVAGASLDTSIILILGAANLVADGFSMAAGAYASSRSEREQYEYLLTKIRQQIVADPARERAELVVALSARGISADQVDGVADAISGNPADFARTLLLHREGVAAVVRNPLGAAVNTFAAFFVCGIAPLLPYVVRGGFTASSIATAIVFFAIGSIRSRWTGRSWWRSGLATLFIGALAAAMAYGIGAILKVIVGTAA